VKPDRVVCLEDGKAFRTLKRHLRTAHGLTPAQYRAKWGLSSQYPLVAPRYAAARSKVAKRIGLGGARAAPQGRKSKQIPRAQRQKAAESGGIIH
jgi:predicted transcriptional regulator